MNKMQEESGWVRVYCRYIRMKDGRIIYPKHGKCFTFLVKVA